MHRGEVFVFLSVCVLVCWTKAPPTSYGEWVEEIVNQAQAASRAHNTGDVSGTTRAVALTEAAFHEAIKVTYVDGSDCNQV